MITALAVWLWLAPYWSTHLLWGLRANLFWIVPLAVLVAAAAAVATYHSDRHKPDPSRWRLAGYAMLGLAAIGCLAWWCTYNAYWQDTIYAQSVRITTDAVPGLTERAPLQVAREQARPNLADAPGDIVDTTYLAASDTYVSLVERRGFTTGYETVLHQRVPLQGQATANRCDFSADADRRIGGNLAGNLGRAINTQRRGVSWNSDDVFGFCADDPGDPAKRYPVVVVPLTVQDGWLVVVERPAGVAVYDGRTGDVEIRENTAGLPGPVYPISLAATQRESTHALGTFADWWFSRAGWEVSEGEDDTNSGNNAEYNLADSTWKTPLYVTPLTGRGSATAISAISIMQAQGSDFGRYALLRVHKLPTPWKSPSSIVSKIKSDYQDLPNWQQIQVMEVAPLDGQRWAATLGDGQNIRYRAQGAGTLRKPDGGAANAKDPAAQPTCLYRETGEVIRCGTEADRNGNGIGMQYGQNATPGNSPAGRPLDQMPNEDLADLGKRVQEEMSKRLVPARPR